MLIYMNDPYPVKEGECGTITHIDDAGQIHVNWDSGSSLAVIPDVDQYLIL